MPDLRVVSARPVSISRNGKIKARKRKPNSLSTLSTVTGFVYPGGNTKLVKDATTDPYAKKRRKAKAKRRPKKRTNAKRKRVTRKAKANRRPKAKANRRPKANRKPRKRAANRKRKSAKRSRR